MQSRYLFNLLYLPILLIGMKFGYDAGALALLLVQLLLLVALDLSSQPIAIRRLSDDDVHPGDVGSGARRDGHRVGGGDRRSCAGSRPNSPRSRSAPRNGAMAAAMSHEISQPLASIAAYMFGARRLLETGQGEDKALAALRKAEGEAARARGIVERLRDFVAKGAIAREMVDLDELVETILRLQSDAARERGVRVATAPAAEAAAARARRPGRRRAGARQSRAQRHRSGAGEERRSRRSR